MLKYVKKAVSVRCFFKWRKEEMNMKKISPVKLVFGIIGGVFFALGVLFACVLVIVTMSGNAEKEGKVVSQAEITDMGYYYMDNGEMNWKVQIHYEFQGEEYEKYIKHYSDSMHEGQIITIYIDPHNPINTYEPGDTFVFILVFGILGAVFGLIGVVFLLVCIFAGKKKKDLLLNGKKIYAEVTGGDYCYNYNVNGRHPFKLECKYVDPGTNGIYMYSSEVTWMDPSLYIGHTVEVFVDKKNPRRYYVNLESLEKTVEVFDYR